MWPTSLPHGVSPHGGRLSIRCQKSCRRGSRSGTSLPAMMRGVDGADRGADHPVRLDAGFVQGLIDPALIGAERAAALKDQHHLARKFGRLRNGFYGLMKDIIHDYLSARLARGSAMKTSPQFVCLSRPKNNVLTLPPRCHSSAMPLAAPSPRTRGEGVTKPSGLANLLPRRADAQRHCFFSTFGRDPAKRAARVQPAYPMEQSLPRPAACRAPLRRPFWFGAAILLGLAVAAPDRPAVAAPANESRRRASRRDTSGLLGSAPAAGAA